MVRPCHDHAQHAVPGPSERPGPSPTSTGGSVPIPFERIRQNPPPGSGTVDDVDRLNNHEDRLYELVDGILVEKTVGLEESFVAMNVGTLLNVFVQATRTRSGRRSGWHNPA